MSVNKINRNYSLLCYSAFFKILCPALNVELPRVTAHEGGVAADHEGRGRLGG